MVDEARRRLRDLERRATAAADAIARHRSSTTARQTESDSGSPEDSPPSHEPGPSSRPISEIPTNFEDDNEDDAQPGPSGIQGPVSDEDGFRGWTPSRGMSTRQRLMKARVEIYRLRQSRRMWSDLRNRINALKVHVERRDDGNLASTSSSEPTPSTSNAERSNAASRRYNVFLLVEARKLWRDLQMQVRTLTHGMERQRLAIRRIRNSERDEQAENRWRQARRLGIVLQMNILSLSNRLKVQDEEIERSNSSTPGTHPRPENNVADTRSQTNSTSTMRSNNTETSDTDPFAGIFYVDPILARSTRECNETVTATTSRTANRRENSQPMSSVTTVPPKRARSNSTENSRRNVTETNMDDSSRNSSQSPFDDSLRNADSNSPRNSVTIDHTYSSPVAPGDPLPSISHLVSNMRGASSIMSNAGNSTGNFVDSRPGSSGNNRNERVDDHDSSAEPDLNFDTSYRDTRSLPFGGLRAPDYFEMMILKLDILIQIHRLAIEDSVLGDRVRYVPNSVYRRCTENPRMWARSQLREIVEHLTRYFEDKRPRMGAESNILHGQIRRINDLLKLALELTELLLQQWIMTRNESLRNETQGNQQTQTSQPIPVRPRTDPIGNARIFVTVSEGARNRDAPSDPFLAAVERSVPEEIRRYPRITHGIIQRIRHSNRIDEVWVEENRAQPNLRSSLPPPRPDPMRLRFGDVQDHTRTHVGNQQSPQNFNVPIVQVNNQPINLANSGENPQLSHFVRRSLYVRAPNNDNGPPFYLGPNNGQIRDPRSDARGHHVEEMGDANDMRARNRAYFRRFDSHFRRQSMESLRPWLSTAVANNMALSDMTRTLTRSFIIAGLDPADQEDAAIRAGSLRIEKFEI